MEDKSTGRMALLWPGDRKAQQDGSFEGSRFRPTAEALLSRNIAVERALYADAFADEVRQQLLQVDGVLVWVNPLDGGHDRSILDTMLRDVASKGVYVSTHPDVILKMGTKEVLVQTRDVGWGSDTHLYARMEDLRQQLPTRLSRKEVRVLKQYRGNGGDGVWKVEVAMEGSGSLQADTPLRVRHAKRGSVEEQMTLSAFLARCEPYFENSGRMIDQAYQDRLPEGMIRCYLVHDKVAGFGHQAVNALFPPPPGAPPQEAPQPGPRLYYPPTRPDFQPLKRKLEEEWVPAMQQVLDIDRMSLPMLWDADFLFGPKDAAGKDTYVLCEINVSSVYPFPDSALPFLAEAAEAMMNARHRKG